MEAVTIELLSVVTTLPYWSSTLTMRPESVLPALVLDGLPGDHQLRSRGRRDHERGTGGVRQQAIVRQQRERPRLVDAQPGERSRCAGGRLRERASRVPVPLAMETVTFELSVVTRLP